MATRKYQGYLIEKSFKGRTRISYYDVSRLHDQDSVLPTKEHVARTQTLKGAKAWIDEEVQHVVEIEDR